MNGVLNVPSYVALGSMWYTKRLGKSPWRMWHVIKKKETVTLLSGDVADILYLPHLQRFYIEMLLLACGMTQWLSTLPIWNIREVWSLILPTNIIPPQTIQFPRNKMKKHQFYPWYIWTAFWCNWYPTNIWDGLYFIRYSYLSFSGLVSNLTRTV